MTATSKPLGPMTGAAPGRRESANGRGAWPSYNSPPQPRPSYDVGQRVDIFCYASGPALPGSPGALELEPQKTGLVEVKVTPLRPTNIHHDVHRQWERPRPLCAASRFSPAEPGEEKKKGVFVCGRHCRQRASALTGHIPGAQKQQLNREGNPSIAPPSISRRGKNSTAANTTTHKTANPGFP
jgi:hypothetical protein